MGDTPSLEAESLFARLLVEQGMARPEHVAECLEVIRRGTVAGGGGVPRLGELLVARGYLTLEQFQQTLRPSGSRTPGSSAAAGVPPEVTAAQKDPANLTDKYVRVERIGAGGMGEVWKAWDVDLSRWVALKYLKGQNAEELARFEREAQTAARLSHPGIAAVYQVGRHGSTPFIALQYIQGWTLAQLPSEDRGLIVESVRDAALAVHYAHEQGVIHRDLKPHNIMVEGGQGPRPKTTRRIPGAPRGRSLRVYVLDFGLAKQTSTDSNLSMTGSVLGTPAYMPPEQARGRLDLVDARSDVYSLGATLYELLTGLCPFRSDEIYALMKKVIEEDPKPVRRLNPAVDRDLATIVEKCMEKDPDRRYATVLELAEDLDRYLSGEPIQARPAGLAYRLKKRVARHPVASIAIGVAALALVGTGGVVTVLNAKRATERKAQQVALDARTAEKAAALEAAELCRRALEKVAEGKSLQLRRASRREQWEKLFGQALEEASAAAARHPGLALAHAALGQVREAQERWPEAIAAYDRAVELDPGRVEVWYFRSVCRFHFHDQLMASLSSRDPSRGNPLVWTARAREQKERALQDLQEYGRRRGATGATDPAYRVGMALASCLEGKLDDAERLCDELIRENRAQELPWLIRASVQIDRNQLREALETLDVLLSDVMPQMLTALSLRGAVKFRLGNFKGALADYTRALEIDPSDRPSGLNRAYACESLQDWKGAISDYDRLIERDGRDSQALGSRARARGNLGDVKGAMEDCDRGIQADPATALTYGVRAWLHEGLGDRVRAIRDFDEALAREPRWTLVYEQRGRLRIMEKDFKGGVEDATAALEINPRSAGAYTNRGWAKRELKDFTGAIEDCTRALELAPGYAWPLTNRGWARWQLQDLNGALEDLTAAIACEPRSHRRYLDRALFFMHTGRPAEALRDYTRAVDLSPECRKEVAREIAECERRISSGK